MAKINALCDRMYQRALARYLMEKQRAEQKKVAASRLAPWKIQNLYGGNYLPTNAWKLLTNPDELFPDDIIQMAFVSKHSDGELGVTGVEINKKRFHHAFYFHQKPPPRDAKEFPAFPHRQ